ncbi:hypothetical protein FRC04_009702 [Tulasnella sp. 424]|nr:hypothetical protein FRC04_009702 [Tulasnella sp. 424]
MSPTFLQGGNAAVPYPSPAMRQPEASTPSMLRLPQRPSDIYTGRSRRSPPDALTLTSDRRRARDSIPDGTSTATTNGFVSSRLTASDMPPTTSTRSNDASSSEEGEVSEDEPMDVDTRTALPSATARGSQPEANVVPGDDFSIDERTTWYQGRSPNEPARPGVLDDSITVANYIEAQLLVLDILGWGIPSGELFRGFGISTTLLKTIFNDLQLRLPKDLDSQELPSSSPSRGEEPVLSSTLLSSLGTPPSSVDHDGSGPIPAHSQSAQRASPSPSDAEPLRNPTLHQNGISGGEATVSSSSGEELLKMKRSELLAQLQKRKAQALQAKSTIPSASETHTTPSRSSPSPAALPTVDQERSDRTNSTASGSLSVSPRASLSPSPMQEDVQPAGTPKTNAETLSLPPPLPSLPTAVLMEVSEPSTPSLDPPSDPNGTENEVVVTMPGEGLEPPVRKRSKLDLILREKLAKVKAKEAVASRSKSPSVPPNQPSEIPGLAGTSESSPENLLLPRRERSATETTLDAGAPTPRTAVQPPRSTTSSFFSYDVPSTSTPVALDYGLPSPSPVAHIKPPARSYSYDSRSGSRTGKRLRATDFIDDNEVPVFLPMLDPYAKIVIDISEDEDEVDEHLREESPVLTPSEDGEPDTEPRETTPVEPGEPASADAFLGSLMVELVEPSPQIDPNDEIKRLKAKIAAMEAMHKKRITQQEGPSRQTSVDPNAREISTSEAESALSNTPDMLLEDGPTTGVIPIDVGEQADGEDESDDIEEDQDQDEEAEAGGDPPTMYTGDEDGDEGMLDADNSTGKSQYTPRQCKNEAETLTSEPLPRATPSTILPTEVATNAALVPKDHFTSMMFSSPSDAFDTAKFTRYENPIGWYDTASNYPLSASHTIQHTRGIINLMPLRAQALARYDPNKQLCQYEVPGGGACLDPTCGDSHVRDTLPTDEETAKHLADVIPGLDIVQIRGSLLRARKPGSTQSQGFTATVAEALGLLGLR